MVYWVTKWGEYEQYLYQPTNIPKPVQERENVSLDKCAVKTQLICNGHMNIVKEFIWSRSARFYFENFNIFICMQFTKRYAILEN